MKVMREVRITPVLNGFIVHVGCQTMVFADIQEVADRLVDYQKAPDTYENMMIENAVNKTMEVPAPEPVSREEDCMETPSQPMGRPLR
jgi:hypothetical protein